jgi:hypothetical protein
MHTANGFGHLIPPAAERVLHIGPLQPDAMQCYGLRGVKVCRLEHYPPEPPGMPFGAFDAAVVDAEAAFSPAAPPPLEPLAGCLSPGGRISLILRGNAGEAAAVAAFDDALLKAGFLRFKSVALAAPPAGEGRWGIVAVRQGHNPVIQARELAAAGRFEDALRVLNDIPDELVRSLENLSLLATEKQKLLLEWQKSLPPGEKACRHFFKARREFAQVTSALPLHHAAYRHEADFWVYLGDPGMARRTLRSILHVAADDATRRQLDAVPASVGRTAESQDAPEWRGTRRAPRILVLTHDRSDYGMDTLYDGLCRLIGADNVLEYPWKPTLHGRNREAAQNYPCFFNHPCDPRSLERLLAELRDRRFDLIVFADVVQMTRRDEVRRILDAARGLPMVVYDPWDSSHIPMDAILRYTGGYPVGLVFKREMLSCIEYGPAVVPLPFGFSEAPAAEPVGGSRSMELFWAGKRVWSLRPLYLPRLEQLLGRRFPEGFEQTEYSRRLSSAGIGLSLFGSGFDSVRYWEVPAHGVMLLAERPPIRIPSNFADGVSAVFFDDLPELEEKLSYYLARPGEARAIAEQGRRHFLKHHTTLARARQFLGRLEERGIW